jgi:hypothetical protein
MLTEVVLVVVQLRAVEFPLMIVLGCALKVTVGAAVPPFTVTTVEALLLPLGPVAVAL